MASNFPGVNFGQWQEWEQFIAPDGREYRIIPGPTGGAYVLDVAESYRTGQPFTRPNPKPVYDEAERLKQQKKKDGSLTSQLMAPAGVLTGVYAGRSIADALSGSSAAAEAAGGAGQAAAGAAAAPVAASSAPAAATTAPFLEGAGVAPEATAAAGESTLGLSTLGTVPGALGALGAGYFASNLYEGGAKDIVRGKGESDDYTNLMLDINPVTAPINMGLRALGMRSVGRQMKSGKSDDQGSRDAARSALQAGGFIDKNFEATLADGSKFNLGLDGHTKYKNVGENIDGKSERNAWDVDFSNPLAVGLIDKVNPLLDSVLGPKASQKQRSDLTGQIINALTSNAKTQEEVDANFSAMFKPQPQAATAAPRGAAPLPATAVPRGATPLNMDPAAADKRKQELQAKYGNVNFWSKK